MYVHFLLEDLEEIVRIPDFSAGGSGSNSTCTCFSPEGLEAIVHVPALSSTETSNIKSRLYSLLKEGG
jgi:hypothetical protein